MTELTGLYIVLIVCYAVCTWQIVVLQNKNDKTQRKLDFTYLALRKLITEKAVCSETDAFTTIVNAEYGILEQMRRWEEVDGQHSDLNRKTSTDR